MIEVEIRARINNLEKIKKNLESLGANFLKRKKQVDRVFGHKMFLDDNTMIIDGGFSARIRETDNQKLLEFKEISRQKGRAIEIKSELSDINNGLEFLKKLQWEEAFTVSKERTEYFLNGLTICLDSVEGLGNFIEIEKMIEFGDEVEIKQDCLNLLKEIAPDSVLESRKYGDLIQEKINKGEKV